MLAINFICIFEKESMETVTVFLKRCSTQCAIRKLEAWILYAEYWICNRLLAAMGRIDVFTGNWTFHKIQLFVLMQAHEGGRASVCVIDDRKWKKKKRRANKLIWIDFKGVDHTVWLSHKKGSVQSERIHCVISCRWPMFAFEYPNRKMQKSQQHQNESNHIASPNFRFASNEFS